jgi:hypothetical protein
MPAARRDTTTRDKVCDLNGNRRENRMVILVVQIDISAPGGYRRI